MFTDKKEIPIRDMEQLNDIIVRSSIMFPERTAIIHKDRKVSYSELNADVQKAEKILIEKGVRENEIVALLSENSYEWVVFYFAVVGIGAIIAPLDPLVLYEEICKLLEDNGIKKIIYSAKFEECARNDAQNDVEKFYISKVMKEMEDVDLSGFNAPVFTDVSRICQISFTSGTTGKIKAVKLSVKNIMSDAIYVSDIIIAEPSDRILTVLPLHHMLSLVASLLIPLFYGVTILINDNKRYFLRDMLSFKPNWLVLVPAVVISIYKVIISALSSGNTDQLTSMKLKNVICGGAKLSEKYEEFFGNIGLPLICGYGITECSPVVSLNHPGKLVRGSCGLPLECCEVKIKDPDSEGNGELLIRGDIVFSGYLDEKDTEECFENGWFKTGDIGRIDENGNIFITGRLKKLIILDDGNNVSAEELENLLQDSIPEILETVVYGMDGKITAEIYTEEEDRASIESKIKALNKKMPVYKWIQKVIIREEEFPKTSTMKIKIK